MLGDSQAESPLLWEGVGVATGPHPLLRHAASTEVEWARDPHGLATED